MSLQNLLSLHENLNSSNIVNYSFPKRASVAAILRWKPESITPIANKSIPTNLSDFMDLMNRIPGELELLYIQRAKRERDIWNGHTALPGGKNESNETDIETAIRETKEEIGLDLQTSDFLYLGKLDDKKIVSLKSELMMILVPFVFLQVAPVTPSLTLQPTEVQSIHWVSLDYLFSTPLVAYDPFNKSIINTESEDIDDPTYEKMVVPSIILPTSQIEPVILWGLTLRITQQLVDFAYKNQFPNNNIYSKSRL